MGLETGEGTRRTAPLKTSYLSLSFSRARGLRNHLVVGTDRKKDANTAERVFPLLENRLGATKLVDMETPYRPAPGVLG